MASPSRSSPAQRLASSSSVNNHNSHNGDHELSQSLNKLSLASSPSESSRSPPRLAGERRQSTASNPRAPVPPRGSLTKSNLNGMTLDAHSTPSPGLVRKTSMSSLYSANGRPSSRTATRRSSSNTFLSPSAMKSTATNLPPIYGEASEEKLSRAVSSLASTYLAKELDQLHSTANDQPTETIVILHDDCYGHRYSRPRASKNLLSTIVERPERIQASVLGVSLAYVRLGERHCEGKHAIHATLDPKSLPDIPFRIHKTARKVPLSSTAVTNVHGNKWMEELKMMCDSAGEKLALNGNELVRPDMNRGPDAGPPEHFHQGDLYLCSESLNALEGSLGAVCEAVDTVFSPSPHKRAFVAVRPPGHHCSASFPSGFCWVNNVHVGIMHGILNHGLTHAAIIDFDLHHGDGSQAIAWQHNKRGLAKNVAAWKKTSIGYFSVHDINSYPCEYGDEDKVKNASLCIDNAHGQSIWNVHLNEWKSDAEFWKLYESKYTVLLEKARTYLRLQTERFRAAGQVPRAAIFLSAGFDASEWEGAGMQRHKVNVPTEFYARLTRDVVHIASEEGLGVDGRIISVLEGGYSDRALYSGVLSHLSGLAQVESVTPKDGGANGLQQGPESKPGSTASSYNPKWWSASELDLFDAARDAPLPEPKKPRNFVMGNYSTPTQASNAKMTEVAKIRRSLSGLPASQIIPRSPTPVSPDVPWTAAAYELSKLLIPKDRQVDSCTHSELNAEAAKAKKDRQSTQITTNGVSDAPLAQALPAAPLAPVAPVAPVATTRMSLRERKPVSYLEEDDDYQSRRKTVSGSATIPTTKAPARVASAQAAMAHSRQASRRLSVATTMCAAAATDVQLPSTTSTRPSSSVSVRPTSSMSMTTQTSATINAKKVRPPAAPKKQGGKVSRAAPNSKLPATTNGETGTAAAAAAAAAKLSPHTGGVASPPLNGSNVMAIAGNSPPANAASKDVDQITGEMRRIKITVLTKEQKEARLMAQTAMNTTVNMAAPKEETPEHEQHFPSPVLTQTRSHPEVPTIGTLKDPSSPVRSKSPPQRLRHVTPTKFKADTMIPMTPTIISPTEASPYSTRSAFSPPVQSAFDQAHDEDLFIPYQPNGPPPSLIPIEKPVRILQPNTGSPTRSSPTQSSPLRRYSTPASPVRKGGHGFTPTSAPSFSPGSAQDPHSMSKGNVPVLPQPPTTPRGYEPTKREIPETPEY
ncbi:hypothetical protein GGR50DRAFT_680713 [Xylaria sp. CBS 124048]|nr:hypothetical protein GGR50DRAFT_680713 [Xylaria sp. CBS 124048]